MLTPVRLQGLRSLRRGRPLASACMPHASDKSVSNGHASASRLVRVRCLVQPRRIITYPPPTGREFAPVISKPKVTAGCSLARLYLYPRQIRHCCKFSSRHPVFLRDLDLRGPDGPATMNLNCTAAATRTTAVHHILLAASDCFGDGKAAVCPIAFMLDLFQSLVHFLLVIVGSVLFALVGIILVRHCVLDACFLSLIACAECSGLCPRAQ